MTSQTGISFLQLLLASPAGFMTLAAPRAAALPLTCAVSGFNFEWQCGWSFLYMNVATFEGIVVNGQIRLPENLHVPEQTKVYVVIPGAGQPETIRLMSPRLAHPQQAPDFEKTIIPNANV